MKKSIFLCLGLILGVAMAKAQGNLQFNQVLILDITNPANSVSVPIGKVWKIESAAMNQSNSYAQLQMGGQNYYLLNSASPFNHLPFWVPGNTTVGLIGPSGHLGKLSVIEFNVVP